MTTTFANLAEFFAYVGVEFDPNDLKASEARLSRCVYKSTDCGAWAAIVAPGEREVGRRDETWMATLEVVGAQIFVRDVTGPQGVRSIADAPPAVRDYLLVTDELLPVERIDLGSMTVDEFVAAAASDIFTVTLPYFTVQFTVAVPVTAAHQGAVKVGSIVEGSDAEVASETLYLPFTDEDWDRAVQGVEQEADDLWHEADEDETENADEMPPWDRDAIQFMLLIAKLYEVGLTGEQYDALSASMDLDRSRIDELLARAASVFARIKARL